MSPEMLRGLALSAAAAYCPANPTSNRARAYVTWYVKQLKTATTLEDLIDHEHIMARYRAEVTG